ncbi:MAG: NAD(P)/FAD-dependent oxidoreductase [Chloroflexota bacterium]
MKTDVVIVGGGPAGSSMAMFLARDGISSVILEKETFPRFHIGESMTGETGGLIRNLKLEHKMENPDNVCIKLGLTVYGNDKGSQWYVPVKARDKDWNLYDQPTWQIRRSWFDKMMLDSARERGVPVLPGAATKPLFHDDGSVRGVQVQMADGGLQDIEADMVVDASGQHTFLANAGVTSRKFRGNYDKQIALFSHFAGAVRDPGPHAGDTLIFYQAKYHWGWFIPIDQEVTSIGIVTPAAYFLSKGENKKAFLLRELKDLNHELARRTAEVQLVDEVRATPNYSFQVKDYTGKGFMCIGDSHRFVDPIFSFGLIVAMKEAQHGARAIQAYLNGKDRDLPNPFAAHQKFVDIGTDVYEDITDLFWDYPVVFALLSHQRHPDEMTDALAGRLFENPTGPILDTAAKLLKRRPGDRTNGAPNGSRYHDDPLRERRNPDALEYTAVAIPT